MTRKNLQMKSISLILSIAAIFGLNIYSDDVQQAYLQSTEQFVRHVYLKPNASVRMPAGTVLKLLKPLYGLTDAGDHWYHSLHKHLQHDLGMQKVISDGSLFTKHVRGKLIGPKGTYVDDLLGAGTDHFLQLTVQLTKGTFKC